MISHILEQMGELGQISLGAKLTKSFLTENPSEIELDYSMSRSQLEIAVKTSIDSLNCDQLSENELQYCVTFSKATNLKCENTSWAIFLKKCAQFEEQKIFNEKKVGVPIDPIVEKALEQNNPIPRRTYSIGEK